MDPITLFGDVSLLMIIASAAGGLFGAAFGANIVFGFTGIAILFGLAIAAATGDAWGINYVAFGPVFGPHITFAAAAAAAAYAAKKGYLETGRDCNTPLVSIDKPDVLAVGAAFGVVGYLIQSLVTMIPWFGAHTDSVALTVFISGIIARAMYSDKPVAKWASVLEGTTRWVPWQERPGQLITLATGSSVLAGGIGLTIINLEGVNPTLAGLAHTLPFALSAICILVLALGAAMPVTHHITLTSALAAVTFFPILGGWLGAMVAAVIFGNIAAFGAEFVQRLFYANGDTHIDPPAGIIWFNTTLILGVAQLFG